eukprot:551825-Rhodomonas_salina.1
MANTELMNCMTSECAQRERHEFLLSRRVASALAWGSYPREDKTNNAILSGDVRCSQSDGPDLLRDWGATDQGSVTSTLENCQPGPGGYGLAQPVTASDRHSQSAADADS